MDKIPYFSLDSQMAQMKDNLLERLGDVLTSTAFSGGKYVDQFEKEFAEYLGVREFVGVSSGSDALLLALRAMNLQPGDEVIVPTSTFIATAFAVERLGGKAVFADCDPVTWQIDPKSVEAAVTSRTKGIICVHLYGQVCPMDELLHIAEEHHLFLLEDCAQSQGAQYKSQTVGTFGQAGCFSFYPTKNLGACGEAGGVSANDSEIAAKIRVLRAQGSVVKYIHDELGYNMRMDGMQAAILSEKLSYLDSWNKRRDEIVQTYHKNILSDKIIWQGELSYTKPAWYLAVACVDDRERFMSYMESKDILCGIHYPVPCHLQKVFADRGYQKGDFPHSEWLAEHCVSLPLYPELSDQSVQRVIDACKSY